MNNSKLTNLTTFAVHAMSGDHSGDDFSGDSSADYSGDYSGDIGEDDVNSNYYYPLIILAVIIAFFNTFIVLLVFSNPKLRRNCNALLVSLGVADGATGVIGIPLLIVTALAPLKDNVLCYFVLSTSTWFWFMSVCSIFHLLLIALEQYLAILKPFNHAKIVTKTSVTLTLIMIWAISIGHAFIPWSWIVIQGDEFCMMDQDPDLQRREEIFTITSGTVFFFLPVTIMMYVYFRIVMEAKSHISRIKRDNTVSRSERRQLSPCIRFRGFYIIALMWLVFILCWAPYFITVFMVTISGRAFPFWLDYKITIFRFLPSLLNPLIFMFWKSDLRTACMDLVRNCSRKGRADQQVSCTKQQVTLLNRLSADSTRQSM